MVAVSLVFLTLTAMHRFGIEGLRIRYGFRQTDKIRYALLLGCVIALMIISPNISYSQKKNLSKLEIPAGTTYNLEMDTLIVDELVLKDSAKINLIKPKSVIQANRVTVGVGCAILGVGKEGETGKDGKSPNAPLGLCKAPVHGEAGGSGKDGESGKDISITVNAIQIASKMMIDLHGGHAGDGGKGGNGAHGSNTTAHCKGDGGNGGNGGSGGNGGNGGNLSIFYSAATEVSYFVTKINLINTGGYRGVGGDGGKGGMRGSGPSEKLSKIGVIGKAGSIGKYGTEGRPLFYSITKLNPNGESKTAAAGKAN